MSDGAAEGPALVEPLEAELWQPGEAASAATQAP